MTTARAAIPQVTGQLVTAARALMALVMRKLAMMWQTVKATIEGSAKEPQVKNSASGVPEKRLASGPLATE